MLAAPACSRSLPQQTHAGNEKRKARITDKVESYFLRMAGKDDARPVPGLAA
jgi:uncharacterized protein YihD (DUF1040 family)